MICSSHLGNSKLICSGWKSISLVDVYGSTSFTAWLCGCNLKCPFCHNWRVANVDKRVCRELNLSEFISSLSEAVKYVEYLHVTGGEPLLQYRELIELLSFVKSSVNVKISVNSNLTLREPLRELLRRDLVEHIATDVKSPFSELTGYDAKTSSKLWKLFLESLREVSSSGLALELRIPIAAGVDWGTFEKELLEALSLVNRHSDNYYVVVHPILGPPAVDPKSIDWCREHCNPRYEYLERVSAWLGELGVERVYVRKTGV